MQSTTYVASLLLAGMFLVAAVAKARRPSSTAATFRALAVPAPALLARAVPITEVGLSMLLVVAPRLGGLVALAILTGFSALLWSRIQAGVAVSCGCFGSSAMAPVSGVDLLRNAFLGGLGAAAAVCRGPVRPGLAPLVVVSTAGVIGLLVLGLARLRHDVGAVWNNRLAGEGLRVLP